MHLLTPQEVADRTKLAKATLAKLRVVGGGPPFIRLGTRIVYDAKDVDAWVTAHGKRRSTADGGAAAALGTGMRGAE